ncbi:ElyC/SanA/YdcF family protein [Sulfurimonas aquatica]|nr:ElyC/SanA/YdcF family protein [Sulfurimonas aquatica]
MIGLFFLYKNNTRFSKIFFSLGVILLILFSYQPFSNTLLISLESKYKKYSYNENIKYIHVLGNGHTIDSEQPISSQLSDGSVKRVLEGVIMYKNIPGSKLIFTGYKGDTNTSNAQMNANLAYALGVTKSDVIIGNNPVDTEEEALFTQKIVGNKPFALVTSATHMPRAMTLFKSYGMNPIAAPTNFYKEEVNWLREPDIHSFKNSKLALHEFYGILFMKIKSIFS